MKRRDFVLIASMGSAALAIPSACTYFGNPEFSPSLAQPKSLSLIWDEASIVDIGNKYRLQTPDESGQRALVGLLQDETNDEVRVTEDFLTNRHVLVDGWILSTTEARQCALASIVHAKS